MHQKTTNFSEIVYDVRFNSSIFTNIILFLLLIYRKESLRERSKSPHRPGAKPWTHFAEQGLQSPRELRHVSSPSPPPLPPRAWVCFDEVPERRRTPKRITTLPSASGVVYSYVNPEECSCECHETQGSDGAHCAYRTS